MNQVHIDSASEEAHAISGLHSGKVLVDPHKDHKCHQDPHQEKDDQSSPTIILEEDSKDEEAPNKQLIRAEPNPEVYKPSVPYPHLLSRPWVSTSKNDDTFLKAFRQVTITIPLVDAIQHIPSYAKFLKGLYSRTRKP